MTAWVEPLMLWGCVALLVFWVVGAHNRLVRLRSAAVQSYGALDVLLRRQIDYVQAQALLLLARDDGPAPAEVALLQAANAQLLAVVDATRVRPLEPPAMAALGTALHVMLAAWARLHPQAVIAFSADGTLSSPASPSDAPGMAASSAVPDAMTPLGWPEPHALIEITRAQLNQAVTLYNTAIGQFPAILLSWLFRWRPAGPLV